MRNFVVRVTQHFLAVGIEDGDLGGGEVKDAGIGAASVVIREVRSITRNRKDAARKRHRATDGAA